nr:ribonuclease H-like domain-containing protein [Tanacetum cinerariifolium]
MMKNYHCPFLSIHQRSGISAYRYSWTPAGVKAVLPGCIPVPTGSITVTTGRIPVPAGDTTVPNDDVLVHSSNSIDSMFDGEPTIRFPCPSYLGNHNPSPGIFSFSSYDTEFDTVLNNVASSVEVSPVPTKRIHTIHPQSLIIGDPTSVVQMRSMDKQNTTGDSAFISSIFDQQRDNHTDFQHYGQLLLSPQHVVLRKHMEKDNTFLAAKDKGIFDSGCSRSMTGNKERLDDFQAIHDGKVTFGGGEGRVTGKGTIRTPTLDFENVYYVKELQQFNLFSISHICNKKN